MTGAIILHPVHAIRVNAEHERVRRETPVVPLEILQLIVERVDDVRSVVSFALASRSCRWESPRSSNPPRPGCALAF